MWEKDFTVIFKILKISSCYILQDIGAHSVVTDTALEGHHLCSTPSTVSQRTSYVHEIGTQNTVQRLVDSLSVSLIIPQWVDYLY